MKTKLLILAVGLVGGLGVVGGQALAQPVNQQVNRLPVNPGVVGPSIGLLVNNLSGSIAVTAGAKPVGNVAAFSCSDLVVYVTSRAATPAPAGSFLGDTPKWTRHVHASGTWSSGTCSYSIMVPYATGTDLSTNPCNPPGKPCTGPAGWNDQNAFNLTIQPYGHVPAYACSQIGGLTTSQSGWMSVKQGEPKTFNLSATGTPLCIPYPG